MIFLDLDGPILDVSEKYYRVYRDILAEEEFTPIPKDEYWEAKRARLPDQRILARSGAESFLETFRARRHERIESEPYQRLDALQPTALETLEWLRGEDRLVLVTLRRSRTRLDAQLEWLALRRLFADVLSSGEDREVRWTIKEELMRTSLHTSGGWAGHFMVGDTETDILAGRALGMTTFGVCNGMRTRALIESAGPDFIIDRLSELRTHMRNGVRT